MLLPALEAVSCVSSWMLHLALSKRNYFLNPRLLCCKHFFILQGKVGFWCVKVSYNICTNSLIFIKYLMNREILLTFSCGGLFSCLSLF